MTLHLPQLYFNCLLCIPLFALLWLIVDEKFHHEMCCTIEQICSGHVGCIWDPGRALVGGSGADMEPAAKWTSSPSGLPKWGPCWQPIMGCPFGAHTKPM